MEIINLKWDSNFFKIKVGKIHLYNEQSLNFELLEKSFLLDRYDLLYVQTSTPFLQLPLSDLYDVELMDVQISMSKEIRNNIYKPEKFEFKNGMTNHEIEQCYSIVDETAKVSRFFKEPLIGPSKTKLLYREWVYNSLYSGFADGILIKKVDSIIVGLHIIRTDPTLGIGHCSLICVSDRVQNKGYGTTLWLDAENYWASLRNVKKCIVPFSLKNLQSFNFHLKIGFNRIEKINYIYHVRKKIYDTI